MELKKIASFQVDHTKLEKGMYISRVDGDIVTYDLRLKKPNAEPVLGNGAIHSLEHLVATYARSSEYSERVIYFGPMGCRTGFYLLLRGEDHAGAIELCRKAFAFAAAFEGAVPGVSEAECGNWKEHDLQGAKREAAAYLPVITGYTVERLSY